MKKISIAAQYNLYNLVHWSDDFECDDAKKQKQFSSWKSWEGWPSKRSISIHKMEHHGKYRSTS